MFLHYLILTQNYHKLSFFLFVLSFFLSFFLSFIVWTLLPTHCTCKGLTLHLIKLNDTHSVEPLWKRNRPVSETSICQHTTFTHREPHPHRDSNSYSQTFLDCEIFPLSNKILELKHALYQGSNAVHSKTHTKHVITQSVRAP